MRNEQLDGQMTKDVQYIMAVIVRILFSKNTEGLVFLMTDTFPELLCVSVVLTGSQAQSMTSCFLLGS